MKKTLIAAVLFTCSVSTAALADDAASLWKAKCKGCHGEDGKAKTRTGEKEKIPDLTTAKWQGAFVDADIKLVISEGSKTNEKMKPFKEKLTGQEIDSLVKFIRTLKGK